MCGAKVRRMCVNEILLAIFEVLPQQTQRKVFFGRSQPILHLAFQRRLIGNLQAACSPVVITFHPSTTCVMPFSMNERDVIQRWVVTSTYT